MQARRDPSQLQLLSNDELLKAWRSACGGEEDRAHRVALAKAEAEAEASHVWYQQPLTVRNTLLEYRQARRHTDAIVEELLPRSA